MYDETPRNFTRSPGAGRHSRGRHARWFASGQPHATAADLPDVEALTSDGKQILLKGTDVKDFAARLARRTAAA